MPAATGCHGDAGPAGRQGDRSGLQFRLQTAAPASREDTQSSGWGWTSGVVGCGV